MSHIIFGHKDSDDIVCQSELIFLWAMLEIIHLDTSSHLVRHLAEVDKGLTGNIVIGDLITPISMALWYNLIGMQKAIGSIG